MIQRLRSRYNDVTKQKKDGQMPLKPEFGIIYVTVEFLDWQVKILDYLADQYKMGVDQKTIGKARQYALEKLLID